VPYATVGPDDAVFAIEAARPRHRVAHFFFDPREVVGVDILESNPIVVPLSVVYAKEPEHLVVPLDGPRLDVQIPEAQAGRVGGHREALVGFDQLVLGLLSIRDVEADADQSAATPGRIAFEARGQLHVPHPTVGPHDAVLRVEAAFPRGRG
jgi:hypothetical protein